MVDATRYRHVLGHYPTGVCAVTAIDVDGNPRGMIVGSFTAVSLDPPLVGFFPGKGSATWPWIEGAGGFCVNILSSGQQDLLRQMTERGSDKFAGLSYALSPNGSPILEDVVAWIDCSLESVTEAGDHYFALGHVLELEVATKDHPMLFLRGKYGRFDHAVTVPLTL